MSLFSGTAGRNAAMYQLSTLGNAQTQVNNQLQTGANQGIAALQTGAQQAQAAYDAAKAPTLAALGSGLTGAQGAVQTGYGDAQGALGAGFQLARNDLAGVDALYQPYSDAGASGLGMYQNALGLNGTAGRDAALSAFYAGPQYEWLQQQSADQTARGANAAGMLMGGNTLTAIQDRAGHLAEGAWGGWNDRLSGLVNTGLQANNARASNSTNLANLAMQYGQGQAGLYTGQADQMSNLFSNYGQNVANVESQYGQQSGNLAYNTGAAEAGIYGNLGTNLANTNTKFAQSIADAGAAAYKAKEQADANRVNFILGVGNSLANLGGTLAGPKLLPVR